MADSLSVLERLTLLEGQIHEIERIQDNFDRLLPVGSIIQSFLSEREFTSSALSGTEWVLCDGRSCKGSKYDMEGHGQVVPDCRGRFLRTFGKNSAPVGTAQAQATAMNGLKASTEVGPRRTYTAYEVRAENGNWENENAIHTMSRLLKTKISECPDRTRIREIGTVPGYLHGRFTKPEHAHFAFTALEGDEETRPPNITVNTFLRIN